MTFSSCVSGAGGRCQAITLFAPRYRCTLRVGTAKPSWRLLTMSQVTERDVSSRTQQPHGQPSISSHSFSANAQCQAIICSETVLLFWGDLSNWFENQTVVVAPHQPPRSDEWNVSWHLKLRQRGRKKALKVKRLTMLYKTHRRQNCTDFTAYDKPHSRTCGKTWDQWHQLLLTWFTLRGGERSINPVH